MIVGAGPAGVAAALMSDSLGIDFLLVDPVGIGGRLSWIPQLINYPGATSGPALAETLTSQVRSTVRGSVGLGTVASVEATNDAVTVTMSNGDRTRCRGMIWAAGVRQRSRREFEAIIDESALDREIYLIGPNFDLIEASSATVVLGSDRPIGSLLRDRPHITESLTVVTFGDNYRTGESYSLIPSLKTIEVSAVEISGSTVICRCLHDGATIALTPGIIVTNLGSIPNSEILGGFALRDADGYVIATTGPRIVCVGDVAHASHQRISIAIGDGARAALDYYNSLVGVYRTGESQG